MKYWLWLSKIDANIAIKLLKKYKEPEIIWKLDKIDLLKMGLSEEIACEIIKQKNDDFDSYIKYIIKNNIVQPFKQVFREIYTANEDEKNANELLRFKGFEVSLKKCVSALKTRKWGYSPDVGMRRVFYNANTVCALFREFDLPYLYDWDNDMRELYGAEFYTRNDGRQLDLKDVDSVAFSEAAATSISS